MVKAFIVAGVAALSVSASLAQERSPLEFRLQADEATITRGGAERLEVSEFQDPVFLDKRAVLTGANVSCVVALEGPYGWTVTFMLDQPGTEIVSEVTKANVGRYFGLVLNGRLLSTPHISSPISGPQVDINGGSEEQAKADVQAILEALPDLETCSVER